MSLYLANSPPALALLQEAKDHPEDDTTRIVLADYLEEHGDPDRAEFMRLQCRPATARQAGREAPHARVERLLNRHGGGWLGSLWRWIPRGAAPGRRPARPGARRAARSGQRLGHVGASCPGNPMPKKPCPKGTHDLA
jgi:uncharacterized protein (TIGR02996 family)